MMMNFFSSQPLCLTHAGTFARAISAIRCLERQNLHPTPVSDLNPSNDSRPFILRFAE